MYTACLTEHLQVAFLEIEIHVVELEFALIMGGFFLIAACCRFETWHPKPVIFFMNINS